MHVRHVTHHVLVGSGAGAATARAMRATKMARTRIIGDKVLLDGEWLGVWLEEWALYTVPAAQLG